MIFKARKRSIPIADLEIKKSDISKGAAWTVKTLQQKGFETYIVGGAVRDLILGLHPKDFDVATAAAPEQVKRIFGRSGRIIGRRFRIVHVRRHSELIEVATFRAAPLQQSATADGLITDDNIYGSAREDAFRRDLTANALMLDPTEEIIIDYVGGVADLKKRRLRIIGNAKDRYKEDPVRMLRAVRLAAKLELTLERSTQAPFASLGSLLAAIPQARLFDETVKMFMCGYSSQATMTLEKCGMLFELFPHIEKFDAQQREFAYLALGINDARQRHSGNASLAFAIASLYWPKLAKPFAGKTEIRHDDFADLLRDCGLRANRLITKKTMLDTHDILMGIYRLRRFHNTKRALTILSYAHSAHIIKKALMLEEVRVEANETDSNVLDWWRNLIEDNRQRIPSLPANKKMRRRRPRRRKRAAAGN